jgi:hypothetical protein
MLFQVANFLTGAESLVYQFILWLGGLVIGAMIVSRMHMYRHRRDGDD